MFRNPVVYQLSYSLSDLVTPTNNKQQAGEMVQISGSAVAHMEQGRMDISKARLEAMVSAYGYTQADYLEYIDGKEIPPNLRDECILLLRLCDESKIRTLHSVIQGLTK